MACIARRPRCGALDEPIALEPITDIGAALGIIAAIIAGLAAVGGAIGAVTVVGGVITVGGVAIVGAAGGGAISGALGGIAVIIVVGVFVADRCTQGDGLPECVAGVVNEVVESFDDAGSNLFPFAAMHDRVDLVLKSRFWDSAEDGGAPTFCTAEEIPRRSEILRCYFFDAQVCNAAKGALIGAGVGAVAGVFLAAAAAAAIGCATVIFCLLALLIALIIAAVTALVCAFAGGQIGRAATPASSPSTPGGSGGGHTLAVGDYVTLHGNLRRREHDNNANTLWWVSSASLSGHVSDSIPRPFSYCEVDDEFDQDGCAPLPPRNPDPEPEGDPEPEPPK
ncbi:MAG TPA: hypothetical protein VFJ16_29175 [Longimicrobium sp.]|nr:hypothetical protein [Longimicrobium sp.]